MERMGKMVVIRRKEGHSIYIPYRNITCLMDNGKGEADIYLNNDSVVLNEGVAFIKIHFGHDERDTFVRFVKYPSESLVYFAEVGSGLNKEVEVG